MRGVGLDSTQGELVLLQDQNRSLWDADEIAKGRAVLAKTLALGRRGPYVLQAGIAVLQTESPIDWARIAAVYNEVAELTRSPVVELNRAVATTEAGHPAAALAMVERLDLGGYPYFHSTRGELLCRLGRPQEGRVALERALELTHRDAERRFLQRRLAEL
jgi:RNA polymerase sigma-70 factor, ECF subfamily